MAKGNMDLDIIKDKIKNENEALKSLLEKKSKLDEQIKKKQELVKELDNKLLVATLQQSGLSVLELVNALNSGEIVIKKDEEVKNVNNSMPYTKEDDII